jgi:hypothetical protein
MQVYNISFQITPGLQIQWLEWMQNKFIPMIAETNCFEQQHFYEIDVVEDQAPTYTLQLFTAIPEKWMEYQENLSNPILQELQATWGDQCFHFITTMRIVN